MKKSDVKKNNASRDVIEEKFLSGKRYILKNGVLTTESGRVRGSGRYGFQTVAVRIPVPLLPFIQAILLKCEEIEATRRIVVNNIYNTSPDFALIHDIEQKTNKYLGAAQEEE